MGSKSGRVCVLIISYGHVAFNLLAGPSVIRAGGQADRQQGGRLGGRAARQGRRWIRMLTFWVWVLFESV